MSDPFLGEIRLWPSNQLPGGWAFCDGSLLEIANNIALFAVIGNFYGGDGETSFALPNLKGRVVLHAGQGPGLSNRVPGQTGGVEQVTLTTAQIPAHNHQMVATTEFANEDVPSATNSLGQVPGSANGLFPDVYAPGVGAADPMSDQTIVGTSGDQPHDNRQPFLVLNYIIALQGEFPN